MKKAFAMSQQDPAASAEKSWLHKPAGSIPWVRDVFSLDTRSLAIARIGLGFFLVRWFILAIVQTDIFWTDQGALPRSLAENLLFEGQWSFHLLNGDPTFQICLFVLGLCASLAFTVGYHTRLSSVVSMALLLSSHGRNPWIVDGGDIILRSVIFWMIWLPIGARFSVDARRKKQPFLNNQTTSIACIALMLQMAAIYFFNGLHKSDPVWHTEGTAVALALQSYGTPLGLWLADFPSITRLMTHGVLWMELFLPWLVFSPWKTTLCRIVAVVVFISFHLGLFLTMELGIFPLIAVAAWLAFIPGTVWNKICGEHQESHPDSVPEQRTTPRWKKAALTLLLVLMMAWNLGTLVRSRDHIPVPLQNLSRAMGLDQNWKMFAPAPTHLDAWFLFEGKTAGEDTVNAYSPEKTFTRTPPKRISVLYKDLRWRKYFEHLAGQNDPRYAKALASFLCQNWNKDLQHGLPLESISVYFQRSTQIQSDALPPPLVIQPCP